MLKFYSLKYSCLSVSLCLYLSISKLAHFRVLDVVVSRMLNMMVLLLLLSMFIIIISHWLFQSFRYTVWLCYSHNSHSAIFMLYIQLKSGVMLNVDR